jgi:subfamily B ATP-binding cassette protein MsbA
MRHFARLLRYLVPHGHRVAGLFLSILVFAVLSGVSLTLIPPFLRILFDDVPERARTEVTAPAVEESGGEGFPIPSSWQAKGRELKEAAEAWIFEGDPFDRLLRFCLLFLTLVVVKNLFGYLKMYQANWLEQRVLHGVRTGLMEKYQRLPLSFHDRMKAGHLISRVTNDVTLLRGAVVGGFVILLQNSLLAIFALGLILLTSWRLSLLAILVLPLNVYLIRMVSSRLRRKTTQAQECMADMTSALQESIAGIRVVKAFGMEDFETAKFRRFSRGYFRNYLKMKMSAALATPITEILGSVGAVVVLGYGGKLVLEGRLHPANLIMFMGAMLWVISPVKALANLNTVIQEGLAAARRVFAVLDLESEPSAPPETVEAGPAGGPARGGAVAPRESEVEPVPFGEAIRFEDVTFAYDGGPPVLREVTLEVRRGDTIALVGPSGAGKSTLVDLVPRFYDPVRGRITLDGTDVRRLPLEGLRGLMGVVTQETILFNDTVRNNIAYGLEDFPEEKIEAAARAANADGFIAELSRGYDTLIGDRGVQLSGGQRQRLAIARAILKNPEILIFDEATSNLDPEGERLVQEAIERLMRGRTNFVIAHRLSTIRNAQKIVVLEGGRIREAGTHEELLSSGGTYRRYFEMQVGVPPGETGEGERPVAVGT